MTHIGKDQNHPEKFIFGQCAIFRNIYFGPKIIKLMQDPIRIHETILRTFNSKFLHFGRIQILYPQLCLIIAENKYQSFPEIDLTVHQVI